MQLCVYMKCDKIYDMQITYTLTHFCWLFNWNKQSMALNLENQKTVIQLTTNFAKRWGCADIQVIEQSWV